MMKAMGASDGHISFKYDKGSPEHQVQKITLKDLLLRNHRIDYLDLDIQGENGRTRTSESGAASKPFWRGETLDG